MMKFFLCAFFLSVGIAVGVAAPTNLFAPEANVATLLRQGDLADTRGDALQALTLFKAAEKIAPHDPEVLVRLADEYSNCIDDAPQTSAKRNAEATFRYAKRAVALSPKSSRAHLALSVAYGRMTDYVSNKTKIAYSRFIRDEAKKAIALDPKNDLAWHVLGRWNSGIADVNPMLQWFVRIIYGGLPAASNEEAARCLARAAQLAPHRIINHTELAAVYEKLGEKKRANHQWKIALSLTANDKAGRDAQQQARTALGSK